MNDVNKRILHKIISSDMESFTFLVICTWSCKHDRTHGSDCGAL